MPESQAGQTPDEQQDPASLSYEAAIEELEEIVDQIESGEIGLEAAVERYERGIALLRRCRSVLDRAEQRIEHLSLSAGDGDGAVGGAERPGVSSPGSGAVADSED